MDKVELRVKIFVNGNATPRATVVSGQMKLILVGSYRSFPPAGPSCVVLISGPRQVGKTTLVRELIDFGQEVNYVTFDDVGPLSFAKRDPVGFIGQFVGTTIIDEIQRAPELFLPIKATVDRSRKPGSFILTGSANVFVLPRLADSLAGRMQIIRRRSERSVGPSDQRGISGGPRPED